MGISESKPATRGKFMKGFTHVLCKEGGAAIIQPSAPLPLLEEWLNEAGATLEAQADFLRQILARRAANKDNGDVALVVDHYEQMLTDLEHQIAAIFPQSEPLTSKLTNEEVAILEAQAKKLHQTIAHRRANKDDDAIVDHYERVLADLEHQIARFYQ